MSLRAKTILIVSCALIVFVLALSVASSSVFLRGYIALDAEHTHDQMKRAVEAIWGEVDDLNRMAGDWAMWDDTCRFVEQRDRAYIDSNLTTVAFSEIQVEVMLFFDAQHRLVFGKAVDLATQQERPPAEGLVRSLIEHGQLLRHDGPESVHKGLLVPPEGIFLISSRPIVDSQKQGPVRGTLVFGRRIDAGITERLSATTGLSLAVESAGGLDPSLPRGIGVGDKDTPRPIDIRVLNDNQLCGEAMIPDLLGRLALRLRAEADRAFYKEGLKTVRRFLYTLVAGGILSIVIMLTLLERLLLAPLSRLSTRLTAIAVSQDTSRRVPGGGAADEWGRLAGDINAVLDASDRSQQELEAQKEQLRAQQEELVSINRDLKEVSIRAEGANHAKSQFLANMSHEIRTPMTAILGFAELLLDPQQSEAERIDCVHTIRRNGSYLLNLLNDILDLSKVEAGKVELERIECSPVKLVRELEALMRVRSNAKGLELRTAFDGPVPQVIQTDPTRVRQILTNLLGNAIKFTETGEVRLILRFVPAVESFGRFGEDAVEFEVSDTGVGIASDQLARLFEPFMQADASTTRKFGGTGLGLTIGKRLAEELGGSISVESTLGVGSVFRVRIVTGPLQGIPMVTVQAEQTAVRDLAGSDVPMETTSPLDVRILLAEDGPDNQRLVSFILRKAGAEVELAENGQIAMEKALAARDEGRPFDLILMDMQMPVLDGYEATRRLRAEGYRGPIVALTAHAMVQDCEKCRSVGCDDYASKPIDRDRLLNVVRACLPDRPACNRRAVEATMST